MELFCQEFLIDRPPKSRPLLLSRPAIIGLRKVSLSLVPLLRCRKFLSFPRRKGISEKPRNSTRNIFFPAEQKQEKSWPHTHLELQERENAFIRLLILKYVDGRKRKGGSHSSEKVFPLRPYLFLQQFRLCRYWRLISLQGLFTRISHTQGKKKLGRGSMKKIFMDKAPFSLRRRPHQFSPAQTSIAQSVT